MVLVEHGEHGRDLEALGLAPLVEVLVVVGALPAPCLPEIRGRDVLDLLGELFAEPAMADELQNPRRLVQQIEAAAIDVADRYGSVDRVPEDLRDVVRRVEHEPQSQLEVQELLHALAKGDVGEGADDGHGLAVSEHGGLVHLDPDLASVLPLQLELVGHLALARVDRPLRELEASLVHRVVRDQLGPADPSLLGLHAQQIPRLRTHVREHVIHGVGVEDVRDVFDEVAIALHDLARPLLGPVRHRAVRLGRLELQAQASHLAEQLVTRHLRRIHPHLDWAE